MLIAFAIYDDSGQPITTATPTLERYVSRTGAPTTQPMLQHLGDGVYGFTSSAADDANGRAYLVATGANPPYVAGSLGRRRLLAFALFDASGVPLAGATPTFEAYLDSAGGALPEPTIDDLGGGLYGFDPGAVRAGFEVVTGAHPEWMAGTANPEDFGGDHVPPVLSGFDPAPGTPITADTALAFDVTDDSLEPPDILLVVRFPGGGAAELAHDGHSFAANYEGSTTPIVGGYRVTGFRRRGGWPSSPTLTPYVGDPL